MKNLLIQSNYKLNCTIFCICIGSTFRHNIYPAYKSNRPPTPDTIVQGLQYLKASIKSMSVKVIEVISTLIFLWFIRLLPFSLDFYFMEFCVFVFPLRDVRFTFSFFLAAPRWSHLFIFPTICSTTWLCYS